MNKFYVTRVLVFLICAALLAIPACAFTITPASPEVGTSVNFVSAKAMNGPMWDFGDGTQVQQGTSVWHTFGKPGSYTVINYGTGIDYEKITDQQTVVVRQNRVTPVAVITVTPEQPVVSGVVTFDASRTSDPSGIVTFYRWDFGDNTVSDGRYITHSYTRPGQFTVTLKVGRKDDSGVEIILNSAVTTVTVRSPLPPVAKFTIDPLSPEEEDTVYFDASGSSAPDGTITTLSWDFGDGRSATMPGSDRKASHAYSSTGEKRVTLTVTDNSGNSGLQTRTLTVVPLTKPHAIISADTLSSKPGQAVTFDALKSVDPRKLIDRYEWDFGDMSTGSGKTVSHTFTGDGNYRVTLTIRSSSFMEKGKGDAYSDTATYLAVVSPYNPPVADFVITPARPVEKETVSFDGSGSHGTEGTIVSYRWDFGDGTNAEGAIASHSYQGAGTYTVLLTVTDTNRKQGTRSSTVPVGADLLPLAIAGVAIIATGTIGHNQYKKYRYRKACPKVPVEVHWSGGAGMKGEPPGNVKIDIRFSGGIRNERKK